LIEDGRLLEHNSRIGCSSVVLLEVSEALAERQRGGSLGVEDRGRRTRSREKSNWKRIQLLGYGFLEV
jgi:hypothetical protein